MVFFFYICSIKIKTFITMKSFTQKNIQHVEVKLKGNHLDTELNLGGLYIKDHEKNEYATDIVHTFRTLTDEGDTVITFALEEDMELFADEVNFLLTEEDVLRNNFDVEMYFDFDKFEDADVEVIHAIINIKVKQTTKIVNINLVS